MDMKEILAEAERNGAENGRRAAAYKGPPLKFTFLGNNREATFPWLSHEEAAGTVRMLMRDQLDHEWICCMARDRILHLAQENDRLREALTASGETKAAYIGEFQFSREVLIDGESHVEKIDVPWDTIKQIMAAIRARAALAAA